MPEEENVEELDELRRKGLHDREVTQEERKKIQKRRNEIELRRHSLARSGTDDAIIELVNLQHEVVKLQEYIVELQLASEHQRAHFGELKARANGLWQDLSMLSEESQVRREAVQGYAEAIQKLHEELQKQEEDYDDKRRPK
jgi:chromosome segregation ATPase